MDIADKVSINRRYSMIHLLGEGSQGRVYAAVDSLGGNRRVALKVLSRAEYGARFRFEFEQAKKLMHPHLAMVYDLGIITEAEGIENIAVGSMFYTQELVDGIPSSDWARGIAIRDRSWEVAKVGVAVARALALLHKRGLLHRDVKPSNILVGPGEGQVKLIDLGLSSLKDAAHGFRAGTIGYMAPEALHGYPEERSDLYSLGVTLAELLTEIRPRPLIPLPRQFPEWVPEKFVALVKRMSSEKPDQRLTSARESVLALARAVGAGILGADRAHDVIDATSEAGTYTTRAAQIRTPDLVGRASELTQVREWIETSLFRAGSRCLATAAVIGPPGVGKSRLFRTGMVEAQLRAVEEGHVPPSLLMGDLRALIRLMAQHAAPILGAHLGPWLKADGVSGEMLSVEKSGEALIEEMTDAILALKQPSVILIEDGDLNLVGALLCRLSRQPRQEGDTPLAIAAEVRDQAVAERMKAEGVATSVTLIPLSTEAEGEIVENALGRRSHQDFLRRFHQLTGGIPLLTESVLAALFSLREDGRIEEVDFDALSLQGAPEELVLKGFLRGLSDVALTVAKSLATIHGPATVEEIAVVADYPDAKAVFDVLREMIKKGFVADENGLFTLKRLAAVGIERAMAPTDSAAFHRRIVGMLEQRAFVEPERLARHAVKAGLTEMARIKAREAADRLIAAGDFAGAKEQLALLLEIGPDSLSERDAVETALARLSRQTGEYERAVTLALAVAERGGALAPRADLERAAALRLAGRTAEAIALLDVLTTCDDLDVALEARAIAARIDLDNGRVEAAAKRLESIPLAAEERLVRSGVLSTGGLIALAAGDHQRARAIFETGLRASDQAADARHQARFHGLLGMVCHQDGNWDEALSHYRTALTLADRTGDRHGAATFAVNLAAALTELDRIDEALSAYRDGLGRLRLVGRPLDLAHAGSNYAQLLLRVGDTEGAEAASRAALADAEKSGDSRVRALALCVGGDVRLSLGKLDGAREALEEAEAIGRASQVLGELTTCRQHLAELALIQGQAEQAGTWLDLAESSGCERPLSLKLEQQRLRLEVALMGEGDKEGTLDQLLAGLPKEAHQQRETHLKAFASSARGAKRLDRRTEAHDAATAALAIIDRVAAKTPSLHRQPETPLEREMAMIRETTRIASATPLGLDTGWRHLTRINTRLNSELRVGRLLEMVMDAAIDITGAERGFLLIADKDQSLKVSCARNIDREALVPDDESYSRTVAKRAFDLAEPILTTDATEDARFNEMLSVVNLSLRYIVAVPLKVDGRATGTIYLDSRRGGYFDEARLTLLEALADQAAIALTNARLRRENRHRQQSIERLNRELQSRLETREQDLALVKGELEKRTHDLITKYRYDEIVARSKSMTDVFRLIDKVVPSSFSVIIRGESGTGKELVAKAIHFNGPRKKKAFVAENCGAIPETLLESVLFGHVRGAFTGAVADNQGLFAEAHEGTLFLDEISEMPLSMQTKLLRVLQEGEVRPVGGSKTLKVDVRILVASNVNLRERVKAKLFREDLYYRLNVIEIELPPLRSRREDIPLLAEHFVNKHAEQGSRRLSREAIEALMDFSWPGNVRQLENEIVRAVVLSDDLITPAHLSDDIISGVSQLSETALDVDMGRQVDKLKRRLISIALKRTGGNHTAAAALLGLSRFGLQKMISRLDMSR